MKKIHLDGVTLDGLANVSSDDSGIGRSSPQSDLNEKGENPKYCRISLFENDADEQISLHVSKTVPNATSYRIKELIPANEFYSDEYLTKDIVKVVKEHVLKYGTIQEIRLVGHGSNGQIGEEGSIFTRQAIHDIGQLEKELNVKVANRIVFDACNTFSGLTEDEIKYYSDFAKQHQVQIVGTTSIAEEVDMFGGTLHILCGRYAQFSPSGKILRDELDTRYDPHVLFLPNDRSWTDFFIGHTYEEGIANKEAYELQQKRELNSPKSQKELERYGPKY